jgi:hypothetical protein
VNWYIVSPASIEPELQPEDLAIAGHPIGAMRGDLFEARLKTEPRGWGLTAEADVGDEVPLGELDERQPMRQRRRLSLESPNHPPC